MEEVLKKFQEKINALQVEKENYREIDDQYSWHIADDEQKVWKEAVEIVKESKKQ